MKIRSDLFSKLPFIFMILFLGIIYYSQAKAGVFDLPAFLAPGEFSLGVEPEIITTDPSGAGINIKPKFGQNDFLNWQPIIGFGTNDRGTRFGITADFDWIPDIENQIGFATPVTLLYQSFYGSGSFNYFVQPMVYKSFKSSGGGGSKKKGKVSGSSDAGAVYTPFVSVPFGWRLYRGNNYQFTQIAMGSMFKVPTMHNVRFTIEAGFEINNSWTYISGGVTWIP